MLLRWGRFFTFDDERELDTLAHEDPIMGKARDILTQISEDPRTVSLAREREAARRLYLAELNEIAAENKASGLAEGKASGLAEALLTVLSARGLPITPEQRARIEATMDVATLSAWLGAAASVASVTRLLEPR